MIRGQETSCQRTILNVSDCLWLSHDESWLGTSRHSATKLVVRRVEGHIFQHFTLWTLGNFSWDDFVAPAMPAMP